MATHKPDYPKHLLALVNDSSLLQNTLDRVAPLSKYIYIVPEASHVEEVKKQYQAKKITLSSNQGGAVRLIA